MSTIANPGSETERERDVVLLQRIAKGDSAASSRFYKLYHNRLVQRFRGKYHCSVDELEELAHVVLTKAMKHAGSFEARNGATPLTWLIAIAHNDMVSYSSRKRRELRVFPQRIEYLDDASEDVPSGDTSPNPERWFQYLEALKDAPSFLNERELAVVNYKITSDLTDEQIGHELGLSEATAKRAYESARDKLREKGLLGVFLPVLGRSPSPEPKLRRTATARAASGMIATFLAIYHGLRGASVVQKVILAGLAVVLTVAGFQARQNPLLLPSASPERSASTSSVDQRVRGARGMGSRTESNVTNEVEDRESGDVSVQRWADFVSLPIETTNHLFSGTGNSPENAFAFNVRPDGTASIRMPSSIVMIEGCDQGTYCGRFSANGNVHSGLRNIDRQCITTARETTECDGLVEGDWIALHCIPLIRCTPSEPDDVTRSRSRGFYLIGRMFGNKLVLGNSWTASGHPLQTWAIQMDGGRDVYGSPGVSGWWPIDGASVLNRLCIRHRGNPVCRDTPAAAIRLVGNPINHNQALLMVTTDSPTTPWRGTIQYRDYRATIGNSAPQPADVICDFRDESSSRSCLIPFLQDHNDSRDHGDHTVIVESDSLTFRDPLLSPCRIADDASVQCWQGTVWYGNRRRFRVQNFETVSQIVEMGLARFIARNQIDESTLSGNTAPQSAGWISFTGEPLQPR